MVEFGIVPTTYGYAAVGLRKTLGKQKNILIRTPVEIPEDVQIRILGRLSVEVAQYLRKVSRWEGIGWVSFIWAVLGMVVLVAARIWTYGLKTAALYGWVRVWFLAGGLWLFLPYLNKIKHRWRAKKLRESVFEIEVERCVDWPLLRGIGDNLDERAYIEEMAHCHPKLAPYYRQMLTVDPPEIMDQAPFTVLGRLRGIVLGTPVRLPRMVYYIGWEVKK